MTINFINSAYYSALMQDTEFTLLRGGEPVGTYVRENPQFKYGSLSYTKFAEEFDHRGLTSEIPKTTATLAFRIVVNIPMAAWALGLKTIYHIALIVFNSVKAIFTRDASGIKANFFHLIRDFEEGTGRILTIFYESLGQYLVQQSYFHRTCYDCFVSQVPITYPDDHEAESPDPFEQKPDSNLWGKPGGDKLPSGIYDLPLRQYKELSQEKRIGYLEHCGLTEQVEKRGYNIDDLINEIAPELLNIMKLSDVVFCDTIKFARLTDEQFAKLTINDVSGANVEFINQRMMLLKKKNINLPGILVEQHLEDETKMKLLHLQYMSPEAINQYASKMHPETFPFLTVNQIKGLKLSILTREQIECLFARKDFKSIFSLIECDEMISTIHQDKLPHDLLKDLPYSYLKKLTLSKLTKEQFWKIFEIVDVENSAYHMTYEKKRENLKQLFSEYPSEDVHAVIIDDKLKNLDLVSDEQLKTLPLSRLSAAVIASYGLNDSPRIALISPDEISKAISANALVLNEISVLTDEQFKQLPVSQMSDLQVKTIAPDGSKNKLIPAEEINKALSAGKKRAGKFLSVDHYKDLRVSQFSSEIIERIFLENFGKYPADLLALIPHAEMNEVLIAGKLSNRSYLSQLSDDFLMQLPLSKLSQKTITDLFPPSVDDAVIKEQRRRFALIPKEEVVAAVELTRLGRYQLSIRSPHQT